ncbi:hypothetical protein RMBD9P1_01400 [Enterococcus faecalis]
MSFLSLFLYNKLIKRCVSYNFVRLQKEQTMFFIDKKLYTKSTMSITKGDEKCECYPI